MARRERPEGSSGPAGEPSWAARRVAPVGVLRERLRPAEVQDPAATFLKAVHAEHGPALFGFALRLTGDRGRAEDAVQETLLQAWKHAEGLAADDRPLRPWLFTVLSHVASSERRARRARPQEVAGDWAQNVAAPPELDRALELWQLQAAVRQLSAQHRQVLLEVYFHGRTLTETAGLLQVPVGTVKSRSFYALRALRLVLEEGGWGHE